MLQLRVEALYRLDPRDRLQRIRSVQVPGGPHAEAGHIAAAISADGRIAIAGTMEVRAPAVLRPCPTQVHFAVVLGSGHGAEQLGAPIIDDPDVSGAVASIDRQGRARVAFDRDAADYLRTELYTQAFR